MGATHRVIQSEKAGAWITNHVVLIDAIKKYMGQEVTIEVTPVNSFEVSLSKIQNEIERYNKMPFSTTDLETLNDIRKKLTIEMTYFSKHVNMMYAEKLQNDYQIRSAKTKAIIRLRSEGLKVTEAREQAEVEIEEAGLFEQGVDIEAKYRYATDFKDTVRDVINSIASMISTLRGERATSPVQV